MDRQISPALIILKLSYFGKKQFVKNGSFYFWFVGSRNCFAIHASRTFNSNSALPSLCTAFSFQAFKGKLIKLYEATVSFWKKKLLQLHKIKGNSKDIKELSWKTCKSYKELLKSQ